VKFLPARRQNARRSPRALHAWEYAAAAKKRAEVRGYVFAAAGRLRAAR